MSTRNISTKRLPKLERLLLDTDVNVELEPLLKAVGFRTEFALRVGVNIRKDVDILRWARRYRYILVCHDKYRDKETQLDIYPELFHNGGKIIRLGGKPGEDIYTSLAKILINRKEWVEWFNENDGIVTVHRSMNTRPAHKLYQLVQGDMELTTDPAKTIRHRTIRPTKPSSPRTKPPAPEQSSF